MSKSHDQQALSEPVVDIYWINIFRIKSAIGIGVGLGANVLVRFALQYSSKIYGLVLINCITRGVRWLEGFSLKVFILAKSAVLTECLRLAVVEISIWALVSLLSSSGISSVTLWPKC